MDVIVAVSVAFALSLLLTRQLCSSESRFYVLDHPNERSLHSAPTPRTGGLAIVATTAVMWALAWVWVGGEQLPALLLPALLVAGVSLLDDYFSIGIAVRFGVHLGVGSLIVWLGFGLPDEVFPGMGMNAGSPTGTVIAVLFVVWMLNLYNFMDGMDGFAGGMAVFGFGGLALVGMVGGHESYALANAIIAAAAGGFLVFNFPPARIFMGDVGSSFLGIMAAGTSLWGAKCGVLPLWIALLLFSPFILDASFTLVRRAVRGERIWAAHRTHIYQRLVRAGWGHRKTVLWEYGFMAACLVTALLITGRSRAWHVAAIIAWGIMYLVALMAATRVESRAARAAKRLE